MAENEYTHHPAVPGITAFVLTGGKSERMGQDKATLRLPSGNTLLEHALAVAGAVASEVRIVGPRERYASFAWAGELIEDIYPNAGPLAGIHAGLCESKTDWALVIAVDMPSLTPEFLRWLVMEAKRTSKLVTVVSAGKGLQPLCAVYRKEFADVAGVALEEGRYKVDASFPAADTRVIGEAELIAAGFAPSIFANVNTPQEFQSATRKGSIE